MRPTEVRLIEEVEAEPADDERLLVYADWLQERGDPRGELIALDVHARAHGERDPRARELEIEVESALLARLDLVGGVEFGWRGGFLREVVLPGKLVPLITARRWLADPAFARLRAVAIDSTTTTNGDEDALALVESAPDMTQLERLAIGGQRLPSPTAAMLTGLFERLPRLRDLELVGKDPIDADRLAALERVPQLEALAVWMPCDDPAVERVLRLPARLRRLTLLGDQRVYTARPTPTAIRAVLDGQAQPALEHLALLDVGYERALLPQLRGRAVMQRLKSLGLAWLRVDGTTLAAEADVLAPLELTWPRPLGVRPDPDHPYRMARRFLVLNRLDEARAHARRACELAPGSYHYWLQLGQIQDARHEVREALETNTRTLRIDRGGREAWTQRGDLLLALGRHDESRLAYERAIELDPNNGRIHASLARVYIQTGRLDDAVAALERATMTPEIVDGVVASLTDLLCEQRTIARVDPIVARYPNLQQPTLIRIDATIRCARGDYQAVRQLVNPTTETNLDTLHLYALACRGLGRFPDACVAMNALIARLECPALIAGAWLELALCGDDRFAAIATYDPAELADQLADLVDATRAPEDRRLHRTHDRPTDRLLTAAYSIAAAALRAPDEVPARLDAFAGWLATSPSRTVDLSYASYRLFAEVGLRAPTVRHRIETLYQVIKGQLPPHVVAQPD